MTVVSRWRALSPILAFLVVLSLTSPAFAYRSRPGETHIASLSSAGMQGSNSARNPTISSDGRFVVFESIARDLVPGVDTRGNHQAYVRDLKTGTTEIVSVSNAGEASNQWVTDPAISDDGRYVVFETNATNLVPQPTVSWQVYLYDRVTDSLRLVSRDASGAAANRSTQNADISGDGRYVVFQSYATNLVEGTGDNRIHVYLYDTETEEIELISRGLDGQPANHDSKDPVITPDGRFIAYHGHATDLVEDPDGPGHDVFVYDRQSGTTELVSVRSDGAPQDKGADTQSISDDGRYVAFMSSATNLVPSQLWDTFGIYVHDRETGVTERVSVSSDGVESSGGSDNPMISGDGRFVAFMSYGFNMAPEEELNTRPDIFVHDLVTHETEKITIAADGGAANSDSNYPSISGDGRYVVYETLASNLHSADTNGRPDAILRDRGFPTGIGRLDVSKESDTASVSGWATFSGTVLSSAEMEPPPGLRDSDAAITGASVTYRVEREDLLFETQLEALSSDIPLYNDFGRKIGVNRGAQVYGWSFEIAGVRWEARAQRIAVTGAPDARPYDQHAKLFRCDPVCIPERTIRGGIGASGPLVRAGVPLETIGLEPGDDLSNVRAFVAGGELTLPTAPVVELSVPDSSVPVSAVSMGTATPDAGPTEVDFETVEVQDGRFSHQLDLAALPPGPRNVWARACLGEVCGSSVAPLPIPATEVIATDVAFTDRSAIFGQFSDETRFEARLQLEGGAPIVAADLVFELTGAESSRSFGATTDENGVASVTPRLMEAPGAYQVTVRYAGSDDHEAAADTRSFVIEPEDTELGLSVEGRGNNRVLTARLSDEDAPAIGIAGRAVDFYADGELIGSATTNDDGAAVLQAPPRYRGGKHDFKARFEGDAYYLPSSARHQT